MNIYSYNNNFNSKNLNKSNINFQRRCKDENTDSKPAKSPLRKAIPYVAAGMLLCGGIKSCSNETFSGTEDHDNIKVEYFNVKKETKDSVMYPLYYLKSKLSADNKFLDNIEIDIADDYKNLDDINSFREYIKNNGDAKNDKGCSFYSDNNLSRRIALQESAHNTDKVLNFVRNGRLSALPAMRQSLMHEIGHQFDNYFGHDHDAKFATTWDSIMLAREKDPYLDPYSYPVSCDDKKAQKKYIWNSGLSDRNVFYEAFKKDLETVKKIKDKDPSRLPRNIDYYIALIDFSKELTYKDIENAEHARSEVYANLFSYATGQDDGDKEKFITCFSNSYKVVKNDIIKYLGDIY